MKQKGNASRSTRGAKPQWLKTIKTAMSLMAERLEGLSKPASEDRIRRALSERNDGSVRFAQCAHHNRAYIIVIESEGERFIACPECIRDIAARTS
jgi:hypothetical protein